MEAMNLRLYPRSSFMKTIVDYYQIVEIAHPIELLTLPNARLDAWISFIGSFYFFDEKAGKFIKAPKNGFFPLSGKNTLVKVKERMICFSIKFFPHVLLYGDIKKLIEARKPIALDKIFDTGIRSFKYESVPDQKETDLVIEEIEQYFKEKLYKNENEKTWLEYILQRIEHDAHNSISVKWLAKEFNLTEKTLERAFLKRLGLTPKMFSKIVRFQKTIKEIERKKDKMERRQLNMSLANGYYDQSHFGKDSKQISGLPPKLLFKQLLPDFPDLIIKN